MNEGLDNNDKLINYKNSKEKIDNIIDFFKNKLNKENNDDDNLEIQALNKANYEEEYYEEFYENCFKCPCICSLCCLKEKYKKNEEFIKLLENEEKKISLKLNDDNKEEKNNFKYECNNELFIIALLLLCIFPIILL